MTAMQIVWLVIGIVGLTLAILLIVFSLVARMGRRRTAETESRYPNALLVVPGANFFGQESAGVGQVRGNGTLVLTSTALIFEMWVPQRVVEIPLNSHCLGRYRQVLPGEDTRRATVARQLPAGERPP
jgi:hypothetical protein